MKRTTYDKSRFTIYNYLSGENMLVAVATEYLSKIEHALKEFGSYKDVPTEWEVRGILIEPSTNKNLSFDEDAYDNEITINCLKDYKPAA